MPGCGGRPRAQVNELLYEVSVRRKPLFYFVTVTVPSYVMCVITVVGLFARASSGAERMERFTLGVMATITSTSTAVLSLVVSEKVPHSSTAVPLLGECTHEGVGGPFPRLI